MKLLRWLIPFVLIAGSLEAESTLPPDPTPQEEAFVALVRRAFTDSNVDILVDLSYRRPSPERNPKLENVREHRSMTLARGLHALVLRRIDQPTREVLVGDNHQMKTDLPARWMLEIWHSPKSKTTFYAGDSNGVIRILIPSPLPK
jgi:hypothetical protein